MEVKEEGTEIPLKEGDEENANDESEEKIEHPTDIIGQWGPYQTWILVTLTTIYFVAPFQNMGIIFYAPTLKFWCKRPPGYENATLQTCQSYEDSSEPCTEFEYDMDGYIATITSEFNLVCDRAWLISSSKSIYQIGYLVSSILSGLISDKYGRMKCYKMAIILEIVSGLAQGYSQSMTQFLAARFVLGIAAYARFTTGGIILIEIVGPLYRARVSLINELGWTGGRILLPIVMYYVRHFRNMQLYLAIYEVLFIFLIWRVPESLRWQLTHDDFAGAEKTMIAAAKRNGVHSDDEVKRRLAKLKSFVDKDEIARKEEAKKTIFDLWRAPGMLRICLIHYLLAFVFGFVNYGMSYNVQDLGTDLFQTTFIGAVSQIPSFFVVIALIDKFKRRPLAAFGTAWRGVMTFVTIALILFVENNDYYILALMFLGAPIGALGGAAFGLMANEMFPTTLRQISIGSRSVVARVASTMAPFIRHLTLATHISVTMGLFATLILLSSGLFFLFPETKDKEIPDTIAEATAVAKSKKKKKSKTTPV